MGLNRAQMAERVGRLDREVAQLRAERDGSKLELLRAVDEAAFLREMVSETTGLTLDGVGALLRLHRLAGGLPAVDRRHELHSFDVPQVLAAMGDRWWPTRLIARAVLPNGGAGIPANTRSRHHAFVANLLRELHDRGMVERRRVTDDGQVLHSKEDGGGRGQTEWRRK